MVRLREPCWSRTYVPVPMAPCLLHGQRERHVVLRGQRRHPRLRALEERRQRRRHAISPRYLPGLDVSGIDSLRNVNGKLFFTAYDPDHGYELWKSDGSEAGTTLVKDINPGPAYSRPNNLTVLGDLLMFTANDGAHGLNCGGPTAARPARFWSKISIPPHPATAPVTSPRWTAGCSSSAMTAAITANCGRATARPTARCWSAIPSRRSRSRAPAQSN